MLYLILISVLFSYYCWQCHAFVFVPQHLQNTTLQVQLPQGRVQGKIKKTIAGRRRYFSFEGIPYATPPIGNLRFKPPIPAKNWDGVLNASRTDVTSCIQITPSVFTELIESEDCLYLNVFTPVKDLENVKTTQLAVMVWIYGGAFLLGSANSTYFGPDYLLDENVIVVHLNYRLASFGFLSTEDLESPGNYGLKDQHLALRWVKNNIRYFGGNPDKITIFGESAGSVSVQYQLMYQKNEGLFQGAISESGSTLCIWAYQRQPRKIAFDLGLAAGINTSNTRNLVEYLRNLSAEKLKSATMKTSIKNSLGIITGIPFAPTVEPEHPAAFLTNKPHQLLLQGRFVKVPYIIGFNSAESFIAKPAVDMATPLLRFYEFNPAVFVPSGMNAGKYRNEVGELIREFYLNDRSSTEQYLEISFERHIKGRIVLRGMAAFWQLFQDFWSKTTYVDDGYFFRPIMESARLFSRLTPTFMYCFRYEGLMGRKTLGYSKVDDYKGVVHTEEMAYIWSRKYLPEPSGTDKIIMSRMVRMWTNFAKTGSPTPERDVTLDNITWTTLSPNMTYLEIDSKLVVKQQYRRESMDFWNGLYEKYGKPPYDTY